jgi:glycosyltransferase involved in cell wall biosynthesis
VIHPPVDVDKYQPNGKPPEDFFLVVSRLVYAKRIDLVVRAFANNGRRLVVIGQGERLRHLKAMATPNVQFLGFQPDEVVRDYYARCRALIFPGEEDFGLTPVEAKASGRPTIAYAAGGALETVQDGQTGLFFPHQTPDSIAQAIDRFDTMEFDADLLRQDSRRFASEIFEKKIRKFVREKYVEYMQTYFGPEEYSK